MNIEFEVHKLNEEGMALAHEIAEKFDDLLEFLKSKLPPGRHLSIVKTKLEEATFFAKKGIAVDPKHQESPTVEHPATRPEQPPQPPQQS